MIRYYFMKHKVIEGEVKLEFVPTLEKVVDIFIKSLPKYTFECLRTKLGFVTLPKN